MAAILHDMMNQFQQNLYEINRRFNTFELVYYMTFSAKYNILPQFDLADPPIFDHMVTKLAHLKEP